MDLPALLERHLTDFERCDGVELDFLQLEPHFALNSRQAEEEYLQKTIGILLDNLLLDQPERDSVIVRSVLQEILGSLLISLVDLLSTPQIVYNLILNFLTMDDLQLRRRYRRIDLSKQRNRDLEIMKGREYIKSIKNSLLDSLLKEEDSVDTGDESDSSVDTSRMSRSSTMPSSQQAKALRRYSRSSTQLGVTPAISYQVDEEAHPLSSSFNPDSPQLRRPSSFDLSQAKPPLDVSPLSPGLRPRSNALHLRRSMNLSPRAGPITPILDFRDVPGEAPGGRKTHLVQTVSQIDLKHIWQTVTTLMMTFLNFAIILVNSVPYLRQRKYATPLDEHWFEFTSHILLLSKPPASKLFMLIKYLLRPLAWFLFGGVLEDSIVRLVDSVTCENQMCMYIRELKDLVWPRGVLLGHPVESDVNVADLRDLLIDRFPAALRYIVPGDRREQSVDLLIRVLEKQSINKRLVYGILDLIVYHLTILSSNKTPM